MVDEVHKDHLNDAQREAVETIDGPLLVIAGPGTGKTELLAVRVANILEKTDTQPSNILCMTFTESGAANMRERLTGLIGSAAYEVQIGTYHAFGGDIIKRFSEYFSDEQLEQPIDAIGSQQIFKQIVDELDYHDPLKTARHYLKDLRSTISDIKRALLTPDDIRSIAEENQLAIEAISRDTASIFSGLVRMPGSYLKALPYYEQTLESINSHTPNPAYHPQLGSLAEIAGLELASALEEAAADNSSRPLTSWKNKWLAKNARDQLVLTGQLQNKRLESLASVLESYQAKLQQRGLYDFDDMILKSIQALEVNDDLRFTLQEQYQYILLDEYQDTNAAQAKIIELLTNNPASEGRPNVMAVGDDDQAIYAFQGAQYSNMLDFFNRYRDTKIVNLNINYRSHADIIHAAQNVSGQIEERLFQKIAGTSKNLTAGNLYRQRVHIERRDFKTHIGEFTYLAKEIERLVEQGSAPSEIAVLAPRHKTLEATVPYLQAKNLPVRYEKRENILESSTVQYLLVMARLVVALGRSNAEADSLWPQVLSHPSFKITVSEIWQTSWAINKLNYQAEATTSWAEYLLEHGSPEAKEAINLFLAVALRAESSSCETILDLLTGVESISIDGSEGQSLASPLYEWLKAEDDYKLYDTTSQLAVLRSKLRDYQGRLESQATIIDLLKLVDDYQEADEVMLNTNPYNESANAIQLMTTYKAKGLEFDHVFILNTNNPTWGGSNNSGSNKISLPHNLAPTRYSGQTDDERLRLLFVALTRAKQSLYLLNSQENFSGKVNPRLKYLDERQGEDGHYRALVLPEKYQLVVSDEAAPPALQAFELDWRHRHASDYSPELKNLLKDRLSRYQLSPSHLNTFLDLQYGGPENLFLNAILRFPSTPGVDGQFGNAIHFTLSWLQAQLNKTSHLPDTRSVLDYFTSQIKLQRLGQKDHSEQLARGEGALRSYLDQRANSFRPGDRPEANFRSDGIVINNAHLTGIVDKLEIDERSKAITVVDYKTGTPSSSKRYKYNRQLYFYKLLVENSPRFRGYQVTSGRLEYIEPDRETGLITVQPLQFKDQELAKVKTLIGVVWQHIMNLNWPDVSAYENTHAASKLFEKALLEADTE